MKSKYKRIFITGASGTGKTIMAKKISEHFNLPFISTSASVVWPKFGFKDHKSAHKHSCYDPRVGNQYQHAVLRQRVDALKGKEFFISDRSPFDNYAYYLMQIGYLNGKFENRVFRGMCEDNLTLADALVFLRYPDDLRLQDNGKRILNPDFQMMVDSIINLVVNRLINHNMPVLEIKTWDIEEKEFQIKTFLTDSH